MRVSLGGDDALKQLSLKKGKALVLFTGETSWDEGFYFGNQGQRLQNDTPVFWRLFTLIRQVFIRDMRLFVPMGESVKSPVREYVWRMVARKERFRFIPKRNG